MTGAGAVRVMPARFATACGACGLTIRKGAPIRYVAGCAANHDACGDPTAPLVRSAGRARSAGRGRRSFTSYRCTHEDYPCCGCDADSRGAYVSAEDWS